MAYEKQTWTTGEVITQEKLNHMEDGIANAGGDAGYECVETKTELFNETVATTVQWEGATPQGTISNTPLINTNDISVSFEGVEYELTNIGDSGNKVFGADYNSSYQIDFSVYPFRIESNSYGTNISTQTAGTYSLKIESVALSVTPSKCFQTAVTDVATPLIPESQFEFFEINGSDYGGYNLSMSGSEILQKINDYSTPPKYLVGVYQKQFYFYMMLEYGETQTAYFVAPKSNGTYPWDKNSIGTRVFAITENGVVATSIEVAPLYKSGVGIRASWAASNYTMGRQAIALGEETTASGDYSTALGHNTTASGQGSHAEGEETTASGNTSHAEGLSTTASGEGSHSEGIQTIANHRAQHVFGRFNTPDSSTAQATLFGTYAEIVGNGSDDSSRSNARTLDWNGNETLQGNLTLGKGSADETTVTATQLKALIALLNQ